MAIDKKYGQVVLERGDIGDDEPVIVFRARDRLLTDVLSYYADLCHDHGSPDFHVALVDERRAEIEQWQREHPDLVHIPASAGYQASLARPDASA